jgi:hypothetical protein
MNGMLAAKLLGSLLSILALVQLSRWLGLGGDVRIRDENHVRQLANDSIDGFEPVDIVIDRAGIGALCRDAAGHILLIRRHGAQFVGRLLDTHSATRLDQNFLTIGTAEKAFGTVTLNLGAEAQIWAASLRRLLV